VSFEASTNNSSAGQCCAAVTIMYILDYYWFKIWNYEEHNKYVRVQEWTRACEQIVYVVCDPGWFIKWTVIVMVMCYLHLYQASTRTGALLPFKVFPVLIWWLTTVIILCKVSFTATNLQAQRGLVQRHTSLGKGRCMGVYVVPTLWVVSSEFPPHPPATVWLMKEINGVLP